ncbi:MAG: c-type cytochrome [Rhodoferax sp.]
MALFLGLFSLTVFADEPPARARASAKVDLQDRLKQALRDQKLYEPLLKTGGQVAAVCDRCHGVGGNSPTPDVPNLAGQNTVYVLEQARQFADGERKHEFMRRMIKVMTSDEKVGFSLFYGNQKVKPAPATNPALTAKGQVLYTNDCESCHEDHGRGDEHLARVAGQQPVYMTVALKRYRAGSGAHPDRNKAKILSTYADGDIDAVVAYMMSMP